MRDGNAIPAEWLVELSAAGEETRQERFSGEETVIRGLTLGKEYTFRLLDTELCALTGNTETVFTPIPLIEADGLGLDALLDGTATVGWTCTSALPAQWTLTCEPADGNEEPRTLVLDEAANGYRAEQADDGSYRCSAALDDLTVGQSYLIRLSAEGLYQSLAYTLPAEINYVASLTAEAGDAAITVQWEAVTQPDEGLLLVIVPDGNEALAIHPQAQTGSSYTLQYSGDENQPIPLPDTDYTFTLLAADGSPLYGHTECSVRSAPAGEFERLGVEIQSTVTGLYSEPQPEDEEDEDWSWDYRDLLDADRRTSFSADETIVLLLRNRSQVTESDNVANVLLVVRDADGKAVDYFRSVGTWSELWSGRRHWVIELPRTPQTPGDYTLELYVSYAHLRNAPYSFPFTITE